jgi:serine/threonine protein kinase
MPEICPKCGTANPTHRSTCLACGAELEVALFAEMFGPPKRLKARYVISSTLQKGPSVSIYRAIDAKNKDRPCIVHQVALTSIELDRREILELSFLREAAAWRARQHPNLLRILDADVQNHRLYLITEPIKGISLRSIIRDRRQAIPEQTLLHWAGQVCDVLEYLHKEDPPAVLGCLSPAAIHVDEAGHLQLIEVGLVRYKQSGLLGPARGVRGYAAPEQQSGKVTPRSDIYALGMILYQLITRIDPKKRPLPSLTKYARGVSDALIEAVSRAYRREPEKRYASASEMRQALLGTSTQRVVELSPLVLVEGQAATTVSGLVQLCASHWEDGLLALTTGRIADWLNQSASALRADGREEDAAEIEKSSKRTLLAQEQIEHEATRSGITAAAREISLNAAYASWLQDMGALSVQPSLEARPTAFDFGVIGARIKAKSAIDIRNRGQGYLSGRVESAVPWLVIPNPQFGCRAGESTEVRVEALGRRLPSGDTVSRQAIHVTSNGGNAWIEAQASSSPPILSVEQRMLSFGPITRGASRVAHLAVANTGGGRLSGLVISRAPWLRVRHPSFSCPAGASAQIAVELLSGELPEGAVRIRRALAVDSDSGQAQVDVTWKWARPALELDTTGLDLGTVERGAQVERVLTLSNGGTAELIGESVSKLGWLTVHPSQFTCAPGASQTISVMCDTSSLPGGSTVETEAITIRANAGTQTLSASVEVLAPQLVVESSMVDLGTVKDGEQAEETVMVGNRGSMPWEGTVLAGLPWLRVEPQEIHCAPGHFMPVTIMLHTEALESGGEYVSDRAIQIRGGGEERVLGARVSLQRPELSVERHSLAFGLIGRTDVASLPFEIANSGTGKLEWELDVRGTWLEVAPTSGVCDTGETVTAQANAYALAVDGNSGQAWLTVRSNGGRADLPASVALSSPLLSVEPQYLELASENYAPSSQTIRISNRGVGELRGTVEALVSWLTCSQSSFACPTGVSTEIDVQVNLENLQEGTYNALDAIRVESNGGTEAIEANLALNLTPRLHVSPQELHFGDETEIVFALENQGYGTLRVQIVPTARWIAVNHREWTVKAGKKARVRVSLSDAPSDAAGSIEIRAPGETIHLPICREQ